MSKDKEWRKKLEDRHADTRRVWSWRFRLDDDKQQEAKKILEEWERHYYEEAGEEVPLSEMMTDLILDMEYSRPSPRMNERRLTNMLIKRMERLEGLIQDIAQRNPMAFSESVQHQRDSEEGIDDDFAEGFWDDFENTGGRK